MSQANKAVNPANVKGDRAERTRIPMSLPQQKLAVPDIPGYHLHWMMGSPSRIAQAKKAGYDFVDENEVDVVNSDLGGDASKSGSTDMGTRVSVVAGGTAENGSEQRLYLMKIRQEYWEEDQASLEDRNEQIASTLRGGQDIGANPHGADNRYVPEANRKAVANLFTRKTRRA